MSLTEEKNRQLLNGGLQTATQEPASLPARNRQDHASSSPFGAAIRAGSIHPSPVREGQRTPRLFSVQEFGAVLAHLPHDLRDLCRFAFFPQHASRRNQIATWSNVHGDVLTLRGKNAKSGERPSVPLIGEPTDMLARRKVARLVKGNAVLWIISTITLPVAMAFRRTSKNATC